MSAFTILRATETPEQAAAYYVRLTAMQRKYRIPLREEFDAHDTPETRYIVILEDIYPVATCRLYPADADSVMLGRIVVLPEYRGRGLGRMAVKAAEDWARELGFSRAMLESRVEKVGFYEKMGYTADPSRLIHGETFECVYMEKAL